MVEAEEVVLGAAVVVEAEEVVVGAAVVVVTFEDVTVVEFPEENRAIMPITIPTTTTRPASCFSLLVLLTCFVCLATFCCR